MNRKYAIGLAIVALIVAALWAAHHLDGLGLIRQLHGG